MGIAYQKGGVCSHAYFYSQKKTYYVGIMLHYNLLLKVVGTYIKKSRR